MLNTVCVPAATALPQVAARNLLGQLVNPNGAQPVPVPAAVLPPAIVQNVPQPAVQPPVQPLVQPAPQPGVQQQTNPMMDMLLAMQAELAEMRRQRQDDTRKETPHESVAQQLNEDEETPTPPKKAKKNKKNKRKNRLSAVAEDN